MWRIRTGEHLNPRSVANDWITADTDDGQPVTVPPTTVRLEPSEIDWFEQKPETGHFWDWYEITEDLRFRKRPRPGRKN